MNSQTIEIRNADGSANVHQLAAGLTVAALHGLESENSLEIAKALYVSTDASEFEKLKQLPSSCFGSAEELLKMRRVYERNQVFPPGMIDKLAQELKAYNDQNLSEKLYGNADALRNLVNQFVHCG